MFIYKIIQQRNGDVVSVNRSDGWSIPVTDPSNTEYQNFKAQILADQAQLEDVDGNVMSPEAAKEYVRSLP
jgi:hypothetical protein